MNTSALLRVDHLDTGVISLTEDASKLKQKEYSFRFFGIRLLSKTLKLRMGMTALSARMGKLKFQSDEQLKPMAGIATDLDEMAKKLSEALEFSQSLSDKSFLIRLNQRQMEELLCQVEDIAETAALASNKEFHEVTAKIIDSHLKSSK